MPIFTLTTDLHQRDHYVGAVKGKILRSFPQSNIVDISHLITPFNIIEGAFVLQNSYPQFPAETIHLTSIDASRGSAMNEKVRYLMIAHNQHYFLGPDNGLFSLLFDDKPKAMYLLPYTSRQPASFPLKNILLPAAIELASGTSLSDIGERTDEWVHKRPLQPITRDNFIQGSIIHIDAYKNAFVNIDRELFKKMQQDRPYRIYYARKDHIERISESYNEVPEGEVVCLFGDNGFLQIAINKDRASELLGLSVGDPIQIEFL